MRFGFTVVSDNGVYLQMHRPDPADTSKGTPS
jgi:hypothetical protein